MSDRQGGSGPRVRGLFVYPLKSGGAVPVDVVDVDEAGLSMDRQWMLVDPEGRFLSLRTHPRMAHLGVALGADTVDVSFPGMKALSLARTAPEGGGEPMRVWFQERWTVDAGDQAAAWMSEALEAPCRLVRAVRPPDGHRLAENGELRHGFADALPGLVISTASLDDLNRRLTEEGVAPLPMARFRPNVVVEGIGPYAEDTWASVRLGDVEARGVRTCPRCAATMVDLKRGEAAGPEPLRTLSAYRRVDRGGPMFGMSIAFPRPGTLRVGDRIIADPAR